MAPVSESKIKYIFTWVALGIFLLGTITLVVFSWNGSLGATPTPALLLLCWALTCGAGIFLFLLAVKKAHRTWVEEERKKKQAITSQPEKQISKKDASKSAQTLDFAAVSKKLVRRTPEKSTLEEAGSVLLKNLGKELEIMAGIFYLRKKDRFDPVATFAMTSREDPYTFKEGEGLSGQVARSKQIMVLTRLPEDHKKVYSGLGNAAPSYLAIIPFIHKDQTVGVLECSGYKFDPHTVESMFRILSRDLMEKLSPNLK